MCCFGNSSQTEAILLALDLLTCSGFSPVPRPVISSVVIVDGRPDDTDNIKHSLVHPMLLLGKCSTGHLLCSYSVSAGLIS